MIKRMRQRRGLGDVNDSYVDDYVDLGVGTSALPDNKMYVANPANPRQLIIVDAKRVGDTLVPVDPRYNAHLGWDGTQATNGVSNNTSSSSTGNIVVGGLAFVALILWLGSSN
jgi:hypothetical protein